MRRDRVLPLIAFALATLCVPRVRGSLAPIHADTARDLLIARDFADGRFTGAGADTSFGHLLQGALWVRVLELRHRFGIGFVAFERVIDLSIALAAAVVAWTFFVAFKRRGNAITWALWLFPTLAGIDHPTLWNPTLLPLTSAFFYLALVVGTKNRSTSAFIAAALALALSMDLHVATSVLLPFLLVVMIARARRPVVAVSASAVGMTSLLLTLSPGAVVHDVRRLPLWAAVAGVFVVAIVGAALRRRNPGVRGVLLAAVGYAGLVLLVLSWASGRALELRYFVPVIAPAALVAGSVLPISAIVDVLIVGAAMFVPAVDDGRFRLREAETVAGELYAVTSFDQLFLHLRGADAFTLLSTVGAFEPRDHHPPPPTGDDILVVRTTKSALPTQPRYRVIDLGHGFAALLLTYRPRIDSTQFEACGARCLPIVPDFRDIDTAGWAARAYPTIRSLRRELGREPTLRMTFAVRPGNDVAVNLFDRHCRDWKASAPRLDQNTRTITFSTSCPNFWFPPFFETPVGDEVLSRVLTD